MKKCKKHRSISFVLVWLILVCGMIPAMFTKPVVVSCVENERRGIDEKINSSNQIASELVLYTHRVLNRMGSVIAANTERGVSFRGQGRMVYLFYYAGIFMQEQFGYQSAECREDGKIFSNRTMIVDYIRRKDSGEILYSLSEFVL